MAEPTGRRVELRGATEVTQLSSAQEAEARHVAEAKATVPHVHLEVHASVGGELPTEAILHAAALALRRVPRVNGTYRDGQASAHERVNVAFAVEAGGTLIHPTVRDADRKDVAQIGTEMHELAERARSGAITQPELAGATFSLADLRERGIARATGIIRRGQAAYLTVGSPASGLLALSLACDARILQAGEGPSLLNAIRELLERKGA